MATRKTKPRRKAEAKEDRRGCVGLGRELSAGDDLVTRLRAVGLPVCIEAAKKIEHLRQILFSEGA